MQQAVDGRGGEVLGRVGLPVGATDELDRLVARTEVPQLVEIKSVLLVGCDPLT
jgi:hypothetical protein